MPERERERGKEGGRERTSKGEGERVSMAKREETGEESAARTQRHNCDSVMTVCNLVENEGVGVYNRINHIVSALI